MDWKPWREHFERNRGRARPSAARAADGLPAAWLPRLASTVARLQAGETGEGRIVNQVRRHGLGDAEYQEAMRLFVAEEGHHAGLLGQVLRALGGRAPEDPWTARWFTRGRRLAGPRAKLVVLLAAEVIAVRFYGAMAEALPDGPLASLLATIRDDEIAHLEFHVAFFQEEARGQVKGAAFAAAWWPVALACCTTVLLDHADTLALLGIDRARLVREMVATIGHVDRRVRADAAPWFIPDAAPATLSA